MVGEKAINKVIETGLENGGGRLFKIGAGAQSAVQEFSSGARMFLLAKAPC